MSKILVVDDDVALLGMLRVMLESAGYDVCTANNGIEAMATIHELRPALVLSDVEMPEMDGMELLALVRRHPSTELIPFILMTKRPAISGMRRGLSRGADYYLPKPLDRTVLTSTIKNCLHRHEILNDLAERRISDLRQGLLSMLPHEFLTPLNGILGVAELLEMGESSETDLLDYAGILRESGQRLLRITTNFLLCSELELITSNPDRLAAFRDQSGTCDGANVHEVVQRRAEHYSRENDLSMVIDPAPMMITPENLDKILEELADNAFKFSQSGTAVVLSGEPEGDFMRFRLIDHGRGMTPEDLEQVDSFIQFERRIQEQQGAGLGIFIARKLAFLHGGNLIIDSVADHGTTVTVEIPLASS